jgi:hypothetical protein
MGPLEAAAFAAAAKGDTTLVEFLTARVENDQAGEHYFDDFLAELQQLHPIADALRVAGADAPPSTKRAPVEASRAGRVAG